MLRQQRGKPLRELIVKIVGRDKGNDTTAMC